MVNVAVSVGATIVTATFTAVPFGGTTTVVLLTETERLIGGGVKAPPPQPVTARTNVAEAKPILERRRGSRVIQGLLDLTILQHLFCHLSRGACSLLQRDLAPQPLELRQRLSLLVSVAESAIHL